MNAPPRAPRDRRYSTQSWRRVRELVRQRDGGTCQVCGKREPPNARRHFPVDHRHPGVDFYDADNLWLLCFSCNTSKAGMSVDEWVARARPKPGQVGAVAYFREKGDAGNPYATRPGPLAPVLLPDPPTGRPSTAEGRFIKWAMTLHGVGVEPRDHDHGSPWAVNPSLSTGGRTFRVCAPSCTSPVRWPA